MIIIGSKKKELKQKVRGSGDDRMNDGFQEPYSQHFIFFITC